MDYPAELVGQRSGTESASRVVAAFLRECLWTQPRRPGLHPPCFTASLPRAGLGPDVVSTHAQFRRHVLTNIWTSVRYGRRWRRRRRDVTRRLPTLRDVKPVPTAGIQGYFARLGESR
jgi:hypothetical protein